MAQVAFKAPPGNSAGGIPEKTLAAGLGPRKEIDVDISAASRSPSTHLSPVSDDGA
jgi:hypothetical protein